MRINLHGSQSTQWALLTVPLPRWCQDCASLQRLSLCFYRGCSLPACPSLRRLRVSNASQLSDLWPLAACVALESLVMSVCHSIRELAPLAYCARLRDIELDRCTGLTAAPSFHALTRCARLTHLTLSRCPGLTSSGLSALAGCSALERLDVDRGPNGLAQFAAPACRVARALKAFSL